jgi:hypothetical protein
MLGWRDLAVSAELDIRRRHEQLKRYRSGPAELEASLRGITDEELDRRPGPGQWSPREIVHHVADAEVIAGGRLRLVLARDAAPIVAYGQEDLMRAMRPMARPIEASLAVIKALHENTADLIEALEEEAWSRRGVHEEVGDYHLAMWLEDMAEHSHKHADQIRRARGP